MTSKRERKPRRRGLGWQTFCERCAPQLWSARITGTPGNPPANTAINWPDDRDLANALARAGFAAGVYKVRPKFRKTLGESWEQERISIGFAKSEPVPSGTVEVTPELAQAPRSPRPTEGPIDEARRSANVAAEQAREAKAIADMAESKQRAKRAEALAGGNDTERLAAAIEKMATPRNDGIASILPQLLQIQQQAADRQMTMLQALLQQSQAREGRIVEILGRAQPGNGGSLAELAKTLELFKTIRGLMGEVLPAPAGAIPVDGETGEANWQTVLLQEGLKMIRERMAASRPAGAPPPVDPAAAARPALAAVPPPAELLPNVATERTSMFVRALLTEAQNGSDPAAVADALDEQLGLLPLAVRTPLEAGNWLLGLDAARPHLDAPTAQLVDNVTPQQLEWLVRFASSFTDRDPQEGVA